MASPIVMALEGWLLIGLCVAIPFLAFGVDRIDPNARGTYTFRVLVLPGILLLWPIVLWRWLAIETGRDHWVAKHTPHRRIHGQIWSVLAVLLPLLLLGALTVAPQWPADQPAVQLSGDTNAGGNP